MTRVLVIVSDDESYAARKMRATLLIATVCPTLLLANGAPPVCIPRLAQEINAIQLGHS